MGRMKELAMEGGATRPSSREPLKFYNRNEARRERQTTQTRHVWSPDDHRPTCMHHVEFEQVDKPTAHILHQRFALIGITGNHYETAHLILIALGVRTAQQVAPASLTHLNRFEMRRLLNWAVDEWDAQNGLKEPEA